MTYSCAIFSRGAETLEEAQRDEARARLHEARAASRASACSTWAAAGAASPCTPPRSTACSVLGITLSEPQAELARERARGAGVADRVEIRVADYRDLGERALRRDRRASAWSSTWGSANIDDYARAARASC